MALNSPTGTNPTGTVGLGSILDEPAPPAAAPVQEAAVIAPPAAAPVAAARGLTRERRKLFARLGALAAMLLVIGGVIWGTWALLPRHKPDYLTDDMDEILDYMLLSEDFNKLPLEERLKMIKDLVHRLKTMTGEDSAMMAAFAASIEKEMRKQMERNIKRLAADMIDNYAKDYVAVPPEKQGEYLDNAIIDFTHLMEDVADQRSGLPENDADRLAAVKAQAKKDQQKMKEGDRKMTSARAGKLFEFVHNDQQNIANPVQRGNSAKFVRDMTRHLRGEDLSTGKPMDGPK